MPEESRRAPPLAEALDRMERSATEGAGRRPAHAPRQAARPRKMPDRQDQRKLDDVMVYEVYTPAHQDVIDGKREPDDILVRQIKARVNAAELTRRDLYAFIGDHGGALFENHNQAYNLERGLGLRPTITLECARRWAAILGGRLGTFMEAEDGWHTKLVQLRDLVLRAEHEDVDFELALRLAKEAVPSDESELVYMPVAGSPEG